MGAENENLPWYLSECWQTGKNLAYRPGEGCEARTERLKKKFPFYDPQRDPYILRVQTKNDPAFEDRLAKYNQQINWLKHEDNAKIVFEAELVHGTRWRDPTQKAPETMCMSWVWPWWWGEPEATENWDEYSPSPISVKGWPVRKLKFQSGLEVFQLLSPVHGYNPAVATLFDPKDTHELVKEHFQWKETEHYEQS